MNRDWLPWALAGVVVGLVLAGIVIALTAAR